MKVRLLQAACGPGGNFKRGDIIDLPAESARRLIENKEAEKVFQGAVADKFKEPEEPEKEEAVDQAAETRETATGTGQRKGGRPRKKVE